jgi:hypothetical protein
MPPSDTPGLLALPAGDRHVVDEQAFPGLSALQTRRIVYGRDRRVVLTHSAALHTAQSRGFDQTLTKTEQRLAALTGTLARGRTAAPAPRSRPRSTPSPRTPGSAAGLHLSVRELLSQLHGIEETLLIYPPEAGPRPDAS